MSEVSTSMSAPLRAVILAREHPLAADVRKSLLLRGLRCVRVETAYEAAAELLAERTDVLVMDLHLVGRWHLRLLDLARQLGVEMLGIGAAAAGISGDDLNGVRLTARASLGDALGRIASAATAETTPAATMADLEQTLREAADEDLFSPEQAPAPPSDVPPADLPPRQQDDEPATEDEDSIQDDLPLGRSSGERAEIAQPEDEQVADKRPEQPAQKPARKAPPQNVNAASHILTSEEISALLKGRR